MWVFLGLPVGGLEGWSGGPQTSPIGGGGRPLAHHSILLTFPGEIQRNTHTFPVLVNKSVQ